MKRPVFFSFATALAALSIGCAHTPPHAPEAAAKTTATDRFPTAAVESKEGRDNLKYERNGTDFFVLLRNGQRCQITSNVSDFKMLPRGSHVLAYETTLNELVMLRLGDDEAQQCYSQRDRKTDVTDQQARIVKWNVVSAAEVPVVLIALDKNGFVKMYDIHGNDVSKLGIRNVEDYRLHPCHGKHGVPFNSKLAFAYGKGRVMTIESNGRAVLDPGNYSSASDFIERNKISCGN